MATADAIRGMRLTWRTHTRAMFKSPSLLIWVLFLLLSPLYVVTSGMPQPGDWLVVIMVPATLWRWNGSFDARTAKMVRTLLLFTAWVFVVNYAWALVLGKLTSPKDFIIHPFFYMFNAAVFICALILGRRNREQFLRITVDIVLLTVAAQVATSFFTVEGQTRGQGFFNSPNQLGYYALLSACLFAMVQRALDMSRLKAAVGITFCAYLALLSASRSSVAGVLVLLFLLMFSNPRTILIASLAAVGLVSLGGPIHDAIEFSQKRATEDRDPHTSFAEERGYDRIWRNPQYVLTGAGEGAYERFVFRKGETRRELHSSFGSVVFSYGVIGVMLFFVFGWQVLRGAPLRLSMLLVPALLYTVAHQGLRFTMFWVVLAVFVLVKGMPDRTKKPHGTRAPAAA